MDMMQIRRAIVKTEPHPVTASGGLVHFKTNVKGLLSISGSGNVTICGENLYDITKVTKGKYINSAGNVVNTPSGYNWSMTDYIPVSGVSKIAYRAIGSTGSAPYSAWYKSDKTLLKTFKQQGTGNNTTTIYNLTVPENACFLRFSLLLNNDGSALYPTFMITAGEEPMGNFVEYSGTTLATLTGRKSLVGINNVWSDSGDVTVTYYKH